MDMHHPAPLLPPPEAVSRLIDQVMTGGDAVLDGPGAAAVLDQAAGPLASQRCRVLRVAPSGPGGLRLSGLVAQVAGEPDLDAQDDASLEAGRHALTVLDKGCDRIVLMVAGAGAMDAMALRYLQLACRTGPSLRLVLAGLPGALDEAEFSYLRTRLGARPVLASAGAPLTPASAVGTGMGGMGMGGAGMAGAGSAAAGPDRPAAPRLAVQLPGRPGAAGSAPPRWVRPAAAALGVVACAALAGLAAYAPSLPVPAGPQVPAAQPAIQAAAGSPSAALLPAVPAGPVQAPSAVPLTRAPDSPVSIAPASTAPAAAVPASSASLQPLPVPPVPPPARSRAMLRQAEARLRDPLLLGRRNQPLPRTVASRRAVPPTRADLPRQPWAGEEDGAPPGWDGRGWQPPDRPWPFQPAQRYPGYGSSYGGDYGGNPYEP